MSGILSHFQILVVTTFLARGQMSSTWLASFVSLFLEKTQTLADVTRTCYRRYLFIAILFLKQRRWYFWIPIITGLHLNYRKSSGNEMTNHISGKMREEAGREISESLLVWKGTRIAWRRSYYERNHWKGMSQKWESLVLSSSFLAWEFITE